MKYKKSYNKNYKRYRKYKKKFYNKKNTKKVGLLKGQVIPNSLFVKLPYSEIIPIIGQTSSGTGIYRENFFLSASDMQHLWAFDESTMTPSEFGPMVQMASVANRSEPYGLYEYSRLYDSYKVSGLKINLSISTTQTQLSELTMIIIPIAGVQFFNDLTIAQQPDEYKLLTEIASASVSDLLHFPGAKYVKINTYDRHNSSITMFRSTKQMLGIKNIQDNNDYLRTYKDSPFTGDDYQDINPTAVAGKLNWGYMIIVSGLDPSQGQITCPYQLDLKATYYTQFTGKSVPIQTQQSAPV